MAKAERPRPTGKEKARGKDEKPQAERFIEAARQIGADETGESFERAFAKIIPPRHKR
jgi:hypothetical protein